MPACAVPTAAAHTRTRPAKGPLSCSSVKPRWSHIEGVGAGRARSFVRFPRAALQQQLQQQQAGSQCRTYRYYIDIHGRLFMEDTWPRNVATCLKDVNFLNMFFKAMRRNDHNVEMQDRYPFVSPCGRELNFISCAATPVVFSRLENGQLFYAGNLSVPFQPEMLQTCSKGWLYHPSPVGDMGLIQSSLAQAWMENSSTDEQGRLVLHLGDDDPAVLSQQLLVQSNV